MFNYFLFPRIKERIENKDRCNYFDCLPSATLTAYRATYSRINRSPVGLSSIRLHGISGRETGLERNKLPRSRLPSEAIPDWCVLLAGSTSGERRVASSVPLSATDGEIASNQSGKLARKQPASRRWPARNPPASLHIYIAAGHSSTRKRATSIELSRRCNDRIDLRLSVVHNATLKNAILHLIFLRLEFKKLCTFLFFGDKFLKSPILEDKFSFFFLATTWMEFTFKIIGYVLYTVGYKY